MTRPSKQFAVRLACAATFALVAKVVGAYPDLFTLERTAVAQGEIWRLWTGHFVHGSSDHYAYDVGAAAVLCAAFGPLRRLWLLAPILSVALLVTLPGLEYYYGLSALLHGWVVVIAARMSAEERGLRASLAFLLVLAVFAKALTETLLGVSLFTSDLDFGGPVLHASHFVGAAVGIATMLAPANLAKQVAARCPTRIQAADRLGRR